MGSFLSYSQLFTAANIVQKKKPASYSYWAPEGWLVQIEMQV